MGTLGWELRGGSGSEIGKGLGGCACWNMRGDCLCPLADAVGPGIRKGQWVDTGGAGGLGVGETLRGAIWPRQVILCET